MAPRSSPKASKTGPPRDVLRHAGITYAQGWLFDWAGPLPLKRTSYPFDHTGKPHQTVEVSDRSDQHITCTNCGHDFPDDELH